MNLLNFISLLKQKKTEFKEYSKNLLERPHSIFNGIWGDRNIGLLSIDMIFYGHNKSHSLGKKSLKNMFKDQDNIKICLLIHGVVDDHQTWNHRNGVNYGLLLKQDFGYTPLYLRYNTGKHISENGKLLSKLLANFEQSFTSINDIIVIAHSMGGLITRSACHYGKDSKWSTKVSKIFYLGCPHMGGNLEKFGNFATSVLKVLPFPYTNMAKDIINLRSSGIKDLRYGHLVDKDWKNKDPDSLFSGPKTIIPLHPDISHFAISSSITKNAQGFLAEVLGDSMVSRASAFGQSRNKDHNLNFYPDHLKQIQGVSHVGLTVSKQVYKVIFSWLKSEEVKRGSNKKMVKGRYFRQCIDNTHP